MPQVLFIIILILGTLGVLGYTPSSQYQVSKVQKFFTSPQNFPNIISASIGSLLRFGSGAFVEGYSIALKLDDNSLYAPVRGFGIRLEESSVFSRNKNIYKRPVKPLELYEFEGCPFCRKVREAVTTLDLDVIFYPCPRGGPNYRSKVMKMGGKQQFPYLVDPNTKVQMYESDQIIAYLSKEYGSGEIPSLLKPSFWTTFSVV